MRWPLHVCFLFVLSACREKVETTTPQVQNITESVYASGKVKSYNQYEVYASVNGIVRQVHVQEGEIVKRGDVLITLVNETPALNRDNARLSADYQSVQANLDKLHEVQANIDLARTRLQNDSLQLQRQRNLWANGIGTRNDLEQRELATRSSATAYQTSLLRHRQLRQQLEFAGKQSKKAYEISTTVSNDYTIRARQNGKVYSLAKEPGELVTVQQPVAVLGDATAFILELQVDEYDIARIKPGQKVMVTMDSHKGDVFEAVVTRVDPIMNERSRSVKIEATFTKQPADLLPNLTAEANVLIRAKQNAMTIPRNYLVDETFVLLENGEKRKVTVGLKDYQRAEITSGLTAADVLKKPAQ